MRVLATFLAALIALAVFLAGGPASALEVRNPDADVIAAEFVSALRDCTAGRRLEIGVLGFPRAFTGLSDADRVAARRLVEALLARQDGVVLKPIADLDKLMAGRANAGGHDPADIAAIFEAARDVAALVHFEGRRTSAGEFALTLVGTTRSGDCLAAAGLSPLRLGLDAGAAVVDLRKLIDAELAAAIRDNAALADIAVEPFRPDGATPYSACNEAVTGAVVEALSRLSADPDLALRGRRVAVRPLPPGTPAPAGAARVSGSFGSDGGGLWLTATLAGPGGEILAAISRAHVAGIACDPRPLDYLESIRIGAPDDPKRLTVTAERAVVPVGGFLKFRIATGSDPLSLHCWALASDRTGFIFLPVPGKEEAARVPAGAIRYFPEDFGYGPIVAGEASDNIFGCFAATMPLSPAASTAWNARYGPAGRARDGALDEEEIAELIAVMRREPGITESYGALKIVP
ncbi:MAG: hypothetical protein R3D02_11260 [Hyphomicrobiales bacterium]